MKRWKGFEHGINLGGWLSQCDHSVSRYESFISEKDIETIAKWGLDHVRLPIDYELIEDDNGGFKEEGFVYIDRALLWCRKYGLNMVLDLHKTFGFSFDFGENEKGFFENEKFQERFYRLWEELAKRYGNSGADVAFELLNEVTEKEYCDSWNRIAKKCIERIRALAPKVVILTGGYWNNSVDALPDLLPPYDDNIVYNFHFYEPLIFTHQGAYWAPGMDTSFRIGIDADYGTLQAQTDRYLKQVSVGFSDFPRDHVLGKEFFEHCFEKAVKIAEERNVALYCGEYGVIDLAAPDDILAWYKMIGETFNEFGIGRAAWSYREMNFSFIDDHMSAILPQVLKYL